MQFYVFLSQCNECLRCPDKPFLGIIRYNLSFSYCAITELIVVNVIDDRPKTKEGVLEIKLFEKNCMVTFVSWHLFCN